jgi:hypothetical protein
MRRAKTLTFTFIAPLALVVGLAACGSSSPSAEKATTTTQAKGSSGTDGKTTTTAADEGGDDTSTTVVATGGGEFCDDLAQLMNESSPDLTDKDAYAKALKESAKKSKELLSKAPDELSDSVEVLTELQDKLLAELEKVDYDITKLPPDVMQSMDSPELTAANQELTSYVKDTCGIEMPDAPVAESPEVPETVAPSGG